MNHPRVWSIPSTNASDGHLSPHRSTSTATCEHPESNQTSSTSSSLVNSPPPHPAHRTSGPAKSATGLAYHASEPSRAKISSARATTLTSSVTLPQPLHLSAGLSTPHSRWRDRHHSTRVSAMLLVLSVDP